MNRIFTGIIAILSTMLLSAQIITTNPAFITRDYNGEIEIIYDAALGTAGLKDYTGTDGVYAHTGVITNASTSDTDWKHAPAWGDNSPKYRLTPLGDNKWQLLITPNMASYYQLNTGEIVYKLAFVFRNGLKTREGKDVGGKDIFVSLYDSGFQLAITNPANNISVSAGTSLQLSVSTSIAADIQLLLNDNLLHQANATLSLQHEHTFISADDYRLIAAATALDTTIYDTVYINVPRPVETIPLPQGALPGINYLNDSTVTLVLHAPGKEHVFLIGEFNNWMQLNAFQMKKDGEYWWTTFSGLIPGHLYAYQYLVDGSLRVSDPYTELVLDQWHDPWINYNIQRFPNLKPYPSGKTEGLVATFQTAKTPYSWEISDFSMPNRENLVIYEMLLRDFTHEKTLEAAIGKLDYLQKLGITAIELMPVNEFDGNESWGYNPNHFFAPDKFYGNPDNYKRFVDEAHKRGMAVILDVVFNHATGANPMAALYWNPALNQTAANNPWFNVTAPHPYSVFHDFNHEYQPTRDYFKRVLQYWIEEYKIDGYRLDLTKGFTQKQSTESTASRYDQSRIDILTEYYEATRAVKADVMFILEHFCDYDEELVLANKGMYLWRNLNYAFSQAAMGYQSGSDFGGLITNPRRWVGYSESHDEERNFLKAKDFGAGSVKSDSLYRISRVPLNIAFTTLLPGPKMLWQFQELGYDYSINSLGGRLSNKPPAWSWLELPHRKQSYELSSKIISLRRLYPEAFTEGQFTTNIAQSDWSNGRRIALVHNSLSMVVVGNFNADAVATVYPNLPKAGLWYEVVHDKEEYIANPSAPISLPAGGLRIFVDRRVPYPTSVPGTFDNTDVWLYPAVTSGKVYLTTDSQHHTLEVYSLQGKLLQTLQNSREIDLSDYSKGLYIIRMNSASGTATAKVIRH